MASSILGLLIIGASIALVGDILANLMRVAEIRSIKRELRRFERSFRSIQKVTYYEKEIPAPGVKLHVVDETKRDDLPKFGDE